MGDLKRKDYEKLLEPLQQDLAAAARWVAATGQRLAMANPPPFLCASVSCCCPERFLCFPPARDTSQLAML